MKLLADSANIKHINEMVNTINITGVTTNPSILASENISDPWERLKAIRNLIGIEKELHVQVINTHYDSILEEAKEIHQKIDDQVFIKIPVTKEGVRAMKTLKKEGFKITATAVYSIQQVLIAANVQADYIAPYVNRMHNLSVNGTEVTSKMQTLLDANNFNSKLLAASFKNTEQVTSLAAQGIDSATISYDIFHNLFRNPIVEEACFTFKKDYENKFN